MALAIPAVILAAGMMGVVAVRRVRRRRRMTNRLNAVIIRAQRDRDRERHHLHPWEDASG